MKIGVIGAGRLGLTFALLCEKAGYDVIVSDKREDYVYNLNHNVCNTNEPFIQQMLFGAQRFSATTDNIEIIKTPILFSHLLQLLQQLTEIMIRVPCSKLLMISSKLQN